MANEPIWAVAMALSKFQEIDLSTVWQCSTRRIDRWSMDSEPSITLVRDGRSYTPIICHFIGLGGRNCPNDLYKAFCKVMNLRKSRPTMKFN